MSLLNVIGILIGTVIVCNLLFVIVNILRILNYKYNQWISKEL